MFREWFCGRVTQRLVNETPRDGSTDVLVTETPHPVHEASY